MVMRGQHSCCMCPGHKCLMFTLVAVSSRAGTAEAFAVGTRAVVGWFLLEGGVFRLLPLSRSLWRPTAHCGANL